MLFLFFCLVKIIPFKIFLVTIQYYVMIRRSDYPCFDCKSRRNLVYIATGNTYQSVITTKRMYKKLLLLEQWLKTSHLFWLVCLQAWGAGGLLTQARGAEPAFTL